MGMECMDFQKVFFRDFEEFWEILVYKRDMEVGF
jgi:hypothetical protein